MARISKAFREELLLQRKTIFGNKRYLFHIIAWIAAFCYLSAEVLADDKNTKTATTINGVSIGDPSDIITSVICALVGAVMVYFFLLFMVPYARYKKQRRYLWIGVAINGMLWLLAVCICGAILGFNYGFAKKQPDHNDIILIVMISSIFSGVIAGAFFSLYYFIDLYDQQKGFNRYRKVLTEKLQAETNFLKTQINPHFLFNTLNNIYSLSLSRSQDAAVITRQLKSLIIYMLQECQKDKVSLQGEIEFLRNYINLEQLRNKQEQVAIDLQIKGDPEGKAIAPLLLVNFIENAFKHGVKAGIEHAYVRINLLVMDKKLSMDIVNSKPQGFTDTTKAIKEDSGIGIRNVERRLALLYPDRHKLRISQSPKEYSVYLTIDL